jgi:small subunit ribosomal protein S15
MGKIGDKEKKDIIAAAQRTETDSGSSQVQISVLTERINYLVEHLKVHKKDNHTRRGLLDMVSRRRKLIKYLNRKSPEVMKELAERLDIKIK